MNYVVLDMEWNQAISYSDMIKEPVFLTGEIIQIGAIMLNDEFKAVIEQIRQNVLALKSKLCGSSF